MNRCPALLLAAAVSAAAACAGSTDAPAARSSPADSPSPAATAQVVVPEVEHVDLRAAYEDLRAAGLRVRFAPDVSKTHRRYARGAIEVDPALWVAETEPGPGDPIEAGGTVVITALECPGRAPACD